LLFQLRSHFRHARVERESFGDAGIEHLVRIHGGVGQIGGDGRQRILMQNQSRGHDHEDQGQARKHESVPHSPQACMVASLRRAGNRICCKCR
jgi:hypothetical protein